MRPTDLEPAKNGTLEGTDGQIGRGRYHHGPRKDRGNFELSSLAAPGGRVVCVSADPGVRQWSIIPAPCASQGSHHGTLAGSVLSLVANVEFPNYPSDSQRNRNPQGNRRWFKATVWRSHNEHHCQCLRSLPSRRMTRHFVDVKAKKR